MTYEGIHKGTYVRVQDPEEVIIEGPLPWVVEPRGVKDTSLHRLDVSKKSPMGSLVAGRVGVVKKLKAHPYVRGLDAEGRPNEDIFNEELDKWGATYEIVFNDGKNPREAWLGPEYLDIITESEYKYEGTAKDQG